MIEIKVEEKGAELKSIKFKGKEMLHVGIETLQYFFQQ